MTDFELNCYGISEADIKQQYMESLTAKMSGIEMVVAGVLSDCQELLSMGADPEKIRKQLNIAKFMLFEKMQGVQ